MGCVSRFDGQLRWLHKVRLYPTCAQRDGLYEMLRITRELYNALLEQRRWLWATRRQPVKSKEQYRELTELRAVDERFAAVYRECEDAVLHRLDLGMGAFFRRIKRGETPGYPRFKSASRWHQLEFPHADRCLTFDERQSRVVVPGVGAVKLRKGRAVPPTYGRAFVVEKDGHWYAVFECHRPAVPAALTGKSVGLDRGVTELVATSDGELIENPKHLAKRADLVACHQRAVDALTIKDAIGRPLNSRDPKRRKAVRILSRAKEREANARRDTLHRISKKIVDRYDLIALEDLKLTNMTRSRRRAQSKRRART